MAPLRKTAEKPAINRGEGSERIFGLSFQRIQSYRKEGAVRGKFIGSANVNYAVNNPA